MSDLVALVSERLLQMENADSTFEFGFSGDREEVARAAIAAVFDYLAEPSEEAAISGLGAMPESNGMISDSLDVWKSMLATIRKEALGESVS